MKLPVWIIDVKVNAKKTHIGIEFADDVPIDELNRIIYKIRSGLICGLEFDYEYVRSDGT